MVEKEVFAGLAAGNQVLKELHKEMSLSDVEKLMDETAESIAYQDEIDEMLSTRLSVAEEEDIEAELDAMVVRILALSLGELSKEKTGLLTNRSSNFIYDMISFRQRNTRRDCPQSLQRNSTLSLSITKRWKPVRCCCIRVHNTFPTLLFLQLG